MAGSGTQCPGWEFPSRHSAEGSSGLQGRGWRILTEQKTSRVKWVCRKTSRRLGTLVSLRFKPCTFPYWLAALKNANNSLKWPCLCSNQHTWTFPSPLLLCPPTASNRSSDALIAFMGAQGWWQPLFNDHCLFNSSNSFVPHCLPSLSLQVCIVACLVCPSWKMNREELQVAEETASDGIGGNDTGLNYKYTTVSHIGKDKKTSCHNKVLKCVKKLMYLWTESSSTPHHTLISIPTALPTTLPRDRIPLWCHTST